MICFSAHFSMIKWQQNVRKGAQTQIREGGHSADGDDEGKVKGGDGTVKSWEVVYLPSAETMRVTPDQGPSRA